MTEFNGVVPALNQALEKRGYAELTPVQEAVLAPELSDADLLVSAQTGSGKTVAFGLALAPTLLGEADRFAKAGAPLALIVAPTRELALQVKRELSWLYEPAAASIASCVGGMDMRDERAALSRGAHIVVGTPGRLVDHIKRGSLELRGLRAVVLDEADEMLDLGFREDLEFILAAAPDERRTLMFSATVSRAIATLAKNYQRNAVRVNTAADREQHVDIDYRALVCAGNERENAIINVLRYFEAKNALVFCATRATVNHLTSRFNNRGFSVVALSGELSQKERTHALQAMRDGRARVCVATDVAARGIDLPDLELVIHADLPKTTESLLHRSGRTGRAGRKGVSVLIVPHSARRRTERLLGDANVKATWDKPPSAAEVRERDDERLLADAALNEPIQDSERALSEAILSRHSAEQIAAAFVRLYRADKSAPEELRDAPLEAPTTDKRGKKSYDAFEGSVWFSLSVGEKTSAEPRWLLPMLCKSGGLLKSQVGAIRVNADDTHVEIALSGVEQFLNAIGPDRRLEKTIAVTRMDAAPQSKRIPAREPRPRKPKPRRDRQPAPAEKSSRPAKPEKSYEEKLLEAISIDPPGRRKPRKPKFSKGGQNAKPKNPGAPSLKKKKPKKKPN